MDNYFSNRISIEQIKADINSNFPPGDARLNSYPPGKVYQQIQRLSGFATLKVPTKDMFASSGGTENFPSTKGQLVIVTEGYNSAGLPYTPTETIFYGGRNIPVYNSIFSGDMRLLDGGKNPIGQTFPPIGSLGYFAYDGVPDGWLELKGQGLLYLKSKFYDAAGNQLSTRVDPNFAYEVTQDTEYTPLFNIFYSWGIVKTTPSNNGWNFFLPKWQGYFIRTINPSSTGVDPGSRIWHPSERTHINASRIIDTSPDFGHIPVVKHTHYSKILQRHFRGQYDMEGLQEDWGTTNFMRFWRFTQNSGYYTRNNNYDKNSFDGRLGTNHWSNWLEYTGEYSVSGRKRQNYNFKPFLSSNGSSRVGFPYYSSHTSGYYTTTHENYVVGGLKKHLQKRYYGVRGWNDHASTDYTAHYHDGEHPNGWTLQYNGQGNNNPWWSWTHQNHQQWQWYYWGWAYFIDQGATYGNGDQWWSNWGMSNWKGYYRIRRWWRDDHGSESIHWFATNDGGTSRGHNVPSGNDRYLPFRNGYGNESKGGEHPPQSYGNRYKVYSNISSGHFAPQRAFGETMHSGGTPHAHSTGFRGHQGRYNSFPYHFHNEVNTYWRANENWWGPWIHYHHEYAFNSSSNNNHYRRYRDQSDWAAWYYGHWWWYWYNRDNWISSHSASYWRRASQNWTFPYHIKRSPEGTNDGTEILNTGNDGDPTTTSGNHSHTINYGSNGIFPRGDYESRPNNIALRLCIKY